MKPYKRKPAEIEAIQWNKHGDHAQVVKSGQGVTFEWPTDKDGKARLCSVCNKPAYEHGYILNSKRGGHIVCPGSYVIPGATPWETVVYSAKEFESKYEVVS